MQQWNTSRCSDIKRPGVLNSFCYTIREKAFVCVCQTNQGNCRRPQSECSMNEIVSVSASAAKVCSRVSSVSPRLAAPVHSWISQLSSWTAVKFRISSSQTVSKCRVTAPACSWCTRMNRRSWKWTLSDHLPLWPNSISFPLYSRTILFNYAASFCDANPNMLYSLRAQVTVTWTSGDKRKNSVCLLVLPLISLIDCTFLPSAFWGMFNSPHRLTGQRWIKYVPAFFTIN